MTIKDQCVMIRNFQESADMLLDSVFALAKSEKPLPKSAQKKVLDNIEQEYSKVHSAILSGGGNASTVLLVKRSELQYLRTVADFTVCMAYFSSVENARNLKTMLRGCVTQHGTWTSFFSKLGVTTDVAGMMLGLFDPYKAESASSFVKYAGLDLDSNKARAMMRNSGMGLTFNPEARAFVFKELMPLVQSKLEKGTMDKHYIELYEQKKEKYADSEFTNSLACRSVLCTILRDFWSAYREAENIA